MGTLLANDDRDSKASGSCSASRALCSRSRRYGGLYDDNHLIADFALAWVAAGAKREGLRFNGAALAERWEADGAKVVCRRH